MELKQIKELMAAMEKMGVKRLRLKEKEKYELELELKDENAPHPSMPPFYVHPEAHRFPTTSAHPHREPAHEPPKVEAKAEEKNGKYITSPMVGTFYTAPNPESPPYVKMGDTIKEGMVVCIIEAMKVMNEIKADKSGTLVKVHVENGHPVEFGTKLFEIV